MSLSFTQPDEVSRLLLLSESKPKVLTWPPSCLSAHLANLISCDSSLHPQGSRGLILLSNLPVPRALPSPNVPSPPIPQCPKPSHPPMSRALQSPSALNPPILQCPKPSNPLMPQSLQYPKAPSPPFPQWPKPSNPPVPEPSNPPVPKPSNSLVPQALHSPDAPSLPILQCPEPPSPPMLQALQSSNLPTPPFLQCPKPSYMPNSSNMLFLLPGKLFHALFASPAPRILQVSVYMSHLRDTSLDPFAIYKLYTSIWLLSKHPLIVP